MIYSPYAIRKCRILFRHNELAYTRLMNIQPDNDLAAFILFIREANSYQASISPRRIFVIPDCTLNRQEHADN